MERNNSRVKGSLYLVSSSAASSQAEDRVFKTGNQVESSGIYNVIHLEHRLSQEITLTTGQVFPRCQKCDVPVRFVLLRGAPGLESAGAFRVSLYELPELPGGEIPKADLSKAS